MATGVPARQNEWLRENDAGSGGFLIEQRALG
jgi:hypothetical protein